MYSFNQKPLDEANVARGLEGIRRAVSNYDPEISVTYHFYLRGVGVTLGVQFLGKANVKSSSISLDLQYLKLYAPCLAMTMPTK